MSLEESSSDKMSVSLPADVEADSEDSEPDSRIFLLFLWKEQSNFYSSDLKFKTYEVRQYNNCVAPYRQSPGMGVS